VIGDGLPIAVEVVALQVVVIELLGDFSELDVGEVLFTGRTEHGEEILFLVGLAERVELLAKFLHEQGDVGGVDGGGKFPVDIEAVENTSGGNAGFEIAVDEEVDATGDEGLPCGGGRCGGGKAGGARKRNQNFKIGVELLELLERGEIAVERAGVGFASDAGEIRSLVVGPGIGDGAAGRRGVTESVGKMREFVGDAVGLEIGDVEAGAVDGPLFEIAADNFVGPTIVEIVGGEGESRAGDGDEQTQGYSERTEFHRTHLETERIRTGESVDLYSTWGKSGVLCGHLRRRTEVVIYSGRKGGN